MLPLLLSGLWAGLLLFLYWHYSETWRAPLPAPRVAAAGLVAISLLARLVPAGLLLRTSNFDIESFRLVGDLVNRRLDVYSAEAVLTRHPYLPLQMYWAAVAARLADITGVPFEFIVRLAPILADAALALVLYWLILHSTRSAHSAWLAGLAYALHPVAVFVSAFHGQFDALPLVAVLLAVAAVNTSAPAAGGWLGLGLLLKSWPVLFVPGFLLALRRAPARAAFLMALAAVPLAGVALYSWVFHGDPVTVVQRALGYNHGVGWWGYMYLLRLPFEITRQLGPFFAWALRYGRFLTLAGLGLVWWLRVRREALAPGLLTVVVAFLAFTHAFSIQYLVWVVPFAILAADHRWLRRYTLAAFAYMLLVYLTLIYSGSITHLLPLPQADVWLIMPSSLPIWLVCVGWLWARLRGSAVAADALPSSLASAAVSAESRLP